MAFISASGTGCAAPTAGWAISLRRAGAAAAAFVLLSAQSPPAGLDVHVERLRSNDGLIQVCLTRTAAHFPDCEDDPDAERRTVRAAETRTVRFRGLPSGDWAAAILHDENANSRLDSFAGIPREGVGFSMNPRFTFGPPRFSAARFTLDGGTETQNVRMRYFL